MSRLGTRAFVFVILAAVAFADPLSAQESGSSRAACFRISAAPECRGYWIVETQFVTPLTSSEQIYPFRGSVPVFDDNNVEFNLGYMINATPTLSLGGAVALGSGSGGVPDGARARLRWWARDGLSLEAEGGIVRTNLGSWVGTPLVGPSVGVRANFNDFGALLLRYDRVEVPADGVWSGGPASALSGGVGVSSGAAVAAGALIGVGLVVILIALGAGS